MESIEVRGLDDWSGEMFDASRKRVINILSAFGLRPVAQVEFSSLKFSRNSLLVRWVKHLCSLIRYLLLSSVEVHEPFPRWKADETLTDDEGLDESEFLNHYFIESPRLPISLLVTFPTRSLWSVRELLIGLESSGILQDLLTLSTLGRSLPPTEDPKDLDNSVKDFLKTVGSSPEINPDSQFVGDFFKAAKSLGKKIMRKFRKTPPRPCIVDIAVKSTSCIGSIHRTRGGKRLMFKQAADYLMRTSVREALGVTSLDQLEGLYDIWGFPVLPGGINPDKSVDDPVLRVVFNDSNDACGGDEAPQLAHPCFLRLLFSFCLARMVAAGEVGVNPDYVFLTNWRSLLSLRVPNTPGVFPYKYGIPQADVFGILEFGSKVRIANKTTFNAFVVGAVFRHFKEHYLNVLAEYRSREPKFSSSVELFSRMKMSRLNYAVLNSTDLKAASDRLHPELLLAQHQGLCEGLGISPLLTHIYEMVAFAPRMISFGKRRISHECGTLLGDATSFVELSFYNVTLAEVTRRQGHNLDCVVVGDDLLIASTIHGVHQFRTNMRLANGLISPGKDYLSTNIGLFLEETALKISPGMFKHIPVLKLKSLITEDIPKECPLIQTSPIFGRALKISEYTQVYSLLPTSYLCMRLIRSAYEPILNSVPQVVRELQFLPPCLLGLGFGVIHNEFDLKVMGSDSFWRRIFSCLEDPHSARLFLGVEQDFVTSYPSLELEPQAYDDFVTKHLHSSLEEVMEDINAINDEGIYSILVVDKKLKGVSLLRQEFFGDADLEEPEPENKWVKQVLRFTKKCPKFIGPLPERVPLPEILRVRILLTALKPFVKVSEQTQKMFVRVKLRQQLK